MKIHLQGFLTTYTDMRNDKNKIIDNLVIHQKKIIFHTIENSYLRFIDCINIKSIYLGEKFGHCKVLKCSLDMNGDVILLLDYFHIEGRKEF